MDDFMEVIGSIIGFIVRMVVFIAVSIIMVPALVLNLTVYNFWMGLFDKGKDVKKLLAFNLGTIGVIFRLALFLIASLVMAPAWFLVYYLHEPWIDLIE